MRHQISEIRNSIQLLDGEQIGHEDNCSETNNCPERNAPAGFLNGFVHGNFGNLVVQLFWQRPSQRCYQTYSFVIDETQR